MSNRDFKRQEYWDNRYETETSYEWFNGYSYFKEHLIPRLKYTDAILTLGCGNSPFSYDMYMDGYHFITNIDYSPVCIELMSKKYKECAKMKWLEMNMLQLKFENETFDVVIEKGTLDAVLVEEKDPWYISDKGFDLIQAALDETSRVLKRGGRFISITFAQPHFRKQLYCRSRYDWNYEMVPVKSENSFEYFVYIMTKNAPLSKKDKEYELSIIEKRKKSNSGDKVFTVTVDDNEDFLSNIAL